MLLCHLFSLPGQGFAQYYITGQDPASVRWRQIRTEKFRLIYPETFEQKALDLAGTLDLMSRQENPSLRAKVSRLPVILHSGSAISNGLTVWAPRRIELYPCPPQESYPQPWLDQLAIHEYRHAIQLSRINRGFTRVLSYLLGEQIIGGILGLYLPTWFLEGDATVSETALTRTGRGRSPRFESDLRAQLLGKGIHSYDKATLGSYRSYLPDAYALGYFLVGESRKKYGYRLWDEAVDRAARYPFMAVPFNSGIRKVTGKWKRELYRQTLLSLDSVWKVQLENTRTTPLRTITRQDPSNHTDYLRPLVLDDTTLVAERTSLREVTRFVLLDRRTGKERSLLIPGSCHPGSLTAGGGYLAWSAPEPDLRWGNRSYSIIRLFQLKSGRKIKLTRKSRYFSPALSPDGSRLAVIGYSENNACTLEILQVPGGQVLQRMPVPEDSEASYPAWSADGRRILLIMLCRKGTSVQEVDPVNGTFRTLLPAAFRDIGRPAYLYGSLIMYSAGYSGVESVYATDTLTGNTWLIAAGPFGTYHPVPCSDPKYILCSDHTPDGLMIAESRLDSSAWFPAEELKNLRYPLDQVLASQEGVNLQDSLPRGLPFPSKKYARGLHIFNLHSWAPLSFDVGNLEFWPGVMVMSQNALSTLVARGGWEYDPDERTGKLFASFDYLGWYPAISFRCDYGDRAGLARSMTTGEVRRFTWQETGLGFAVRVPMNLSRGRYIRTLVPSAGFTLTGVRHNASTPASFTTGWIGSLDFRLTFSQYQRSVARDLWPRWGQAADIRYRHSPAGRNSLGSIFGATLDLYFPGFFRHHGIRVTGSYQRRYEADPIAYSFAGIVTNSRGYSGGGESRLAGVRLNYKLPLACPDLSLGSIVYVKRLKMNLFYDYTLGSDPGLRAHYRSTGAELTADLHLLRIVTPMEVGVRSIYFPGSAGWGFEFLYSVRY